MINVNKAIGMIISHYPTHDMSTCRDLGDRWVFVVVPRGSTGTVYSGTTFPSVLKSSGEFELYNICSSPDAYMKSTEVKIDDPRNKYLREDKSDERLA